MSTKAEFDELSLACSRMTTVRYSTSFSLGIKCLSLDLRDPVYAIYGFVRFADEIVDTLHDYEKATLLSEFKSETAKAIARRVSLNPILNSFQMVYHKFDFEPWLLDAFLQSMEADLTEKEHTRVSYENYILGSAEVVGLMCLKVFTSENPVKYEELKPFAMKLGAAFQKVNFLRDLGADQTELGRRYFPEMQGKLAFDASALRSVVQDIEADFESGLQGILKLPPGPQFGVYLAYRYYRKLFDKIKSMPGDRIYGKRIRINNAKKATLLVRSYVRHKLNLV